MKPRIKKILLIITLTVLVGAGLSAATNERPRPIPSHLAEESLARAEAVGSQNAPDLRFSDIEGNPISLASLRGKVLIIDFWATWCPPCRTTIPILNEVQEKYRQQGLEIVAISLDDSSEEIRAFMKQTPIRYTVVHGDRKIAAQFGGIVGLPTTFLIDRQGKIREKYIGFMSQSILEQKIRNLLSE